MYQYSLQWFRNLFVQAIRLATPAEEIAMRIENLNSFFTYYVYTNICRSLFERHKLLFSFLLTVRILQGYDEIDALEWMVGTHPHDRADDQDNPSSLLPLPPSVSYLRQVPRQPEHV
jgi:dynein heavy chain